MYKVIIDTNVYISGTFWAGSPCQLLKMARGKQFITLISQGILDEITDILTREDKPFKLDIQEVNKVTHKILEYADVVISAEKVNACRDKKDNMVLECAISGRANFIVSSDLDLLSLKEYKGVQIVTVKEILEIFHNL